MGGPHGRGQQSTHGGPSTFTGYPAKAQREYSKLTLTEYCNSDRGCGSILVVRIRELATISNRTVLKTKNSKIAALATIISVALVIISRIVQVTLRMPITGERHILPEQLAITWQFWLLPKQKFLG